MYVFIGLIMNGYGVGYTDSSGNRNRITLLYYFDTTINTN